MIILSLASAQAQKSKAREAHFIFVFRNVSMLSSFLSFLFILAAASECTIVRFNVGVQCGVERWKKRRLVGLRVENFALRGIIICLRINGSHSGAQASGDQRASGDGHVMTSNTDFPFS